MNKQRRKELEKAAKLISEAYGIVEAVKDEEQDAHDNLPESLQYSERGEQMEEYIQLLEGACEGLEAAQEAIEEI